MSLDVYLEDTCTCGEKTDQVYSRNITHNLGRMAREAGIYTELWHPERSGFKLATELVEPLCIGLDRLKETPNHYKQFNPENGWGNYEGLVEFVTDYLKACQEYPKSKITTST